MVTWVIATLLIAISACSSRTVLKATANPETSFREVAVPDDVPRYALAPGETALKSYVQRQVAPVYPPTLVHPDAAPVVVVARLVMDAEGRVESVHPVSNTDTGPDRTLFEAAVEQAAMKWAFTPMWIDKRQPDGMTLRTSKPFSLWFEFRFAMVDGEPTVVTERR